MLAVLTSREASHGVIIQRELTQHSVRLIQELPDLVLRQCIGYQEVAVRFPVLQLFRRECLQLPCRRW